MRSENNGKESVVGNQQTEERKLLFPEKDTDRHTRKIEMLAQFILQVVAIRFLDIIREVAEESK